VAEDSHADDPLPAYAVDRARVAQLAGAQPWPSPVTRDWALGGSTGRGARVCVVDSGIEAGHPRVGGVTEAVVVSIVEDEVRIEPDTMGDLCGHGTACAGIIRELAPVMMSLMVGGRVGAGITAEIGTMKVTEQIDALRALATNPVRKLVVPKVLATTLMFPLLTIISCAVGIFGGLLIAVGNLHLNANFYLRSVIDTVKYNDLASGIGKTFFFGFAIGLIACYNGLRTTGGADGVGRATTETVVTGAITVLILDFFLTKLFLLAF